MNKIALVFLLLIAKLLNAQQQWVIMDTSYYLLDSSSSSISKFYRYTDSVYNMGTGYSIKFPKNFTATDTGYFFAYANDHPEFKILRSLTCLVANYESDLSTIYIDENGDLNFDENEPKIEVDFKKPFVLSITHPSNGGTSITRYNALMNKDSIDENFYIENWGKTGLRPSGAFVEPVKYWLRVQAMNMRYATTIGDKNFRVGLFDINQNGVFNDFGKDLISVKTGNNLTLSKSAWKGAVMLSDSVQITFNNEPFWVKRVTANGDSILLEKATQLNKQNFGIGLPFPKLTCETINGASINIPLIGEGTDFLIIDVWGSWCSGCTSQLPFLMKLLNEKPNVSVLGLNYGDSKEGIRAYMQTHGIDWTNGMLSKDMRKNLFIEGFPTFFLLDKNLVVQEVTLHFHEIEEKIRQLEKAFE
jgi:thiol-disulfide isomerase/thioredoxin